MPVKMILQDGPLDGEEQLVQALNTSPGFEMRFNLPNYQTFAPDGVTVIGLGLVAVYSYSGPGPDPGGSDTWTSSSIYEFTGEYFIAPPGTLVPPSPHPLPPAIFMGALSSMTVNGNDPSPGVQMTGEGDMAVEATTTSVGYATVVMTAETVMIVFRQPWQNVVSMSASTSMTVSPN